VLQPELKADDVFHVIGFTKQALLSGAEMQLEIRLGMGTPTATGKLVEVYFLDSLIAPDPDAFRLYGDYLSVSFYSDAALALSKEYGITLPPAIATITRAELPPGVGISIKMPFPNGTGAART